MSVLSVLKWYNGIRSKCKILFHLNLLKGTAYRIKSQRSLLLLKKHIEDDAYCVSHLKVKKIRRGYIVINTKTGMHSHFRSQYGCYCIIKFIRDGIIPTNEYLKKSYRRLTVENTKYRDRYINCNML